MEMAKWLYETAKEEGTLIDIHVLQEIPFRWLCYMGNKKDAEWLYNLSKEDGNTVIDININNEEPFTLACTRNKNETVDWLYKLSFNELHKKININVDENREFKKACRSNLKNLVEWFYDTSKLDGNKTIDFDEEIDQLFIECCNSSRVDVVTWFSSINPDYTSSVEDDGTISYKVKNLKTDIKNIYKDNELHRLVDIFRDAEFFTIAGCSNSNNNYGERIGINVINESNICTHSTNSTLVLNMDNINYTNSAGYISIECPTCLSDTESYFVKFQCNHIVCAQCYAFVSDEKKKRCHFRCDVPINFKQVKLLKLATINSISDIIRTDTNTDTSISVNTSS